VVRAYQDTCARVIARYEGHIAQYLGDGLLVYFGYPQAHEDDAQRAVRAGLGMVEAMGQLNTRMVQKHGVQIEVRLGIHTGQVVVGEIGGGGKHEQLALGETPNVAARLQGIAAPNTLVISAATSQLLGGFFACQSLGTPPLKGVAQPLEVYQVLSERMARTRLDAAGSASLTPLVGREPEVALLRERWAQVKEGVGQVVLLSGEAGIGKSRLVQVLTAQVVTEPQAWLTPCQCSPYYQNTALYPMIDLLERVALQLTREESPEQKLRKLEGFVMQYGLPLAEAVPLFATLLSLPLSADYAPLNLSPESQKQKTLQALLTIMLKIAAQQPVLFVMEDLHWVDPTTLDFLTLVVDQGPTARIMTLLTFRPDFRPPWTGRAHVTQVTLPRLPHRQAAELTSRVAHGQALPAEVVAQVVAKTDGVPLFVEELTKMVLESSLLREVEGRYELTGPLPPLAIPATLHDSLMARLDRLAAVKAIAQLGATLGREFAYELLQAVAPWDEHTLQQGLDQLVAAEFLYQRGLPPQATYLFKHALIQDAAYQALLKSTRQQYHQRIAQVLVERFPDRVETQPELVAQHYTEAGVAEPAIRYWQQAGHAAQARWAHDEAIAHLTAGLAMVMTLPETRERDRQELTLRINLGKSLAATKGWAAPEAEANYVRAWEICQQAGDTTQLLSLLWGLAHVRIVRADLPKHREVGAWTRALAEQQPDTLLLLMAPWLTAQNLIHAGEFTTGLEALEHAYTLYDPQHHRTYVTLFGVDIGIFTLCYLSHALWSLGYPERAVQRSHQALALAQEMPHPFSTAVAQAYAAMLQQFRREPHTAHAHAEAARALCTEHDFAYYRAWAMIIHGWCLRRREQPAAGLAQMQEGLTALRATGGALRLSYYLALLAEAHGEDHQSEGGLRLLTEAFAHQATTQERWSEAELYRLKGGVLLQQTPPDEPQAEAYFQQAVAVASRQQAKSLELRGAMGLTRLWQRQGKRIEAYELLAPIYGWFTEGFDTADLQEAKALLEELS
jgi:predicted ATPase